MSKQGKPLSPRQQEVAQLAGEGFTNPEIAQKLDLHISTVKRHLDLAISKLGHAKKRDLVKAQAERRAAA